jgi:hypothetical protein
MKDTLISIAPPLLIWIGLWWYSYRTNRKLNAAEAMLQEVVSEKSR